MVKLIENSAHAIAYMTGEITHICRDMAKRAPGSEGPDPVHGQKDLPGAHPGLLLTLPVTAADAAG